MQSGCTLPGEAYSATHSIEQSFDTYGFKQIGRKWLSPYSESGVPQIVIIGDKWFSKHGSDIEAGMGRLHKAGMFGDAFDLYKFFECNNNQDAAVIAVGAMFKTASGRSITNQNQINHQAVAAAQLPKFDFGIDAFVKNITAKIPGQSDNSKKDDSEPK